MSSSMQHARKPNGRAFVPASDARRARLHWPNRAKVVEICREIESRQVIPSLGEMAHKAGLSPYHFHRIFKPVTGITPLAYRVAKRADRVRGRVRRPHAP